MLHHAFKNLDQVDFWIGEKNIRSWRAIEKLGAKYFALRYTINLGYSIAPVVLFTRTPLVPRKR
jgi:hypothetical protein